ncbi:MAG: type II toxin-antitoxin system mRNA interferase toxin, RelE/StbE family [Patescibacteria group bacterium]
MKILYGSGFLRSARKLPKQQKERLSRLLTYLQQNPYDPRLHTKPLSGGLSGLYSLRITREWRVIFRFLAADEIQLIDTGHRKDIYK